MRDTNLYSKFSTFILLQLKLNKEMPKQPLSTANTMSNVEFILKFY